MGLDLTLILDSIPRILDGLWLTLELLVSSALLGTLLGILLLLMRLSGLRILDIPAQAYVYIFRGTPILVQIFIIYYGFPQLGIIRDSILWPIFRDPLGCSIVALSLNSGAYMAEVFRGGFLGVNHGLIEAGKALGLSRVHRFIHISAPLAIRLSIPAYSNEIISLMKATALASTVTLLDMMGIARTIVAETYAPYEIFISLAVIYLIITWVIQRAFAVFEYRMNAFERSSEDP